jgi:hypothetical protein
LGKKTGFSPTPAFKPAIKEKPVKFVQIALASAVLTSLSAHAALPPTVEIISPTGTVYTSSWPASVPISTRLRTQEGEIGALTQFNVLVNNVSITGGNLNPFTQSNTCALAAPITCTTASATDGTVTVPFSVAAPGSYTITATAKYRNADGTDAETVNFIELLVEYPAPPSVANAYLNTPTMKALMGAKQRGCVISKIAEQHAKLSSYGPKGGPYNEAMIQNDASNFLSQCQP